MNLRPPRPERGALPGCATLRRAAGMPSGRNLLDGIYICAAARRQAWSLSLTGIRRARVVLRRRGSLCSPASDHPLGTRSLAWRLASIGGLCDISAPCGILNGFGARCGSSVVEHSLGKGEVESSILSRSTRKTQGISTLGAYPWENIALRKYGTLRENTGQNAGRFFAPVSLMFYCSKLSDHSSAIEVPADFKFLVVIGIPRQFLLDNPFDAPTQQRRVSWLGSLPLRLAGHHPASDPLVRLRQRQAP